MFRRHLKPNTVPTIFPSARPIHSTSLGFSHSQCILWLFSFGIIAEAQFRIVWIFNGNANANFQVKIGLAQFTIYVNAGKGKIRSRKWNAIHFERSEMLVGLKPSEYQKGNFPWNSKPMWLLNIKELWNSNFGNISILNIRGLAIQRLIASNEKVECVSNVASQSMIFRWNWIDVAFNECHYYWHTLGKNSSKEFTSELSDFLLISMK